MRSSCFYKVLFSAKSGNNAVIVDEKIEKFEPFSKCGTCVKMEKPGKITCADKGKAEIAKIKACN